MPTEKRLQDDVVEGERERRAEHDERALGALERELVARAERHHDRDARERDRETDDASRTDPVETEGEREQHGQPGCERDDERRDPRGRVARADVEEHVVAHDDQQPRGGDTDCVGAREPGRPRARQRMYAKPGAAIA